jgi:hypothetical protein
MAALAQPGPAGPQAVALFFVMTFVSVFWTNLIGSISDGAISAGWSPPCSVQRPAEPPSGRSWGGPSTGAGCREFEEERWAG